MRSSPTKPVCQTARTWLKVRCGKGCLAPFTGSTSRLFSAYIHLVDCWIQTRDDRIEDALNTVVLMMQPSEWPLAAEVIAHLGDWCHIDELWSRIKPSEAPSFIFDYSQDRVVAK